jgi:hypothetical protein
MSSKATLYTRTFIDMTTIGIGEARKQMNLKYGKGWRERGLVSNSDDQWSYGGFTALPIT